MDIGISPALARTAGSAALKVLGGMVPGAVREARRKRAVRRTARGLAERVPSDEVVNRLSADELSRLVSYVRQPDFEQLAIQLTGLTLERKRPDKYVEDLRTGLACSLRLHGVATDETAEAVATALLDELWSAVVLAVGEIGQSPHPADMPGITVGASTRAAAAARNCRLLARIENLETIHSFSSAIRSQVSKIESQVRPPHMNSGQRVPLSRLYVDRHVVLNVSDEVLQPTVRLSPKEVMAQHLRTVVLGDPGGGKSTLAAKLAVDLARSSQFRGVVPFLVVMREFAQRFERDNVSVAHYLRTLASVRYQLETTADCIEFLLLNGRAVVIFDGLDELLDTSLRRQVTDAVEAFTYLYPTTTVLVTSRQVGYDQAPLNPGLFTTYRLTEFDDDQVTAYAEKWFALDPTLSRDTQKELAAAFLREGEYVSDLRHNPLMLALMCALYRGEGYIPRNRLDVYERCSVLLFERWDRTRGIRVPLPFEQHVRPALWSLALSMFVQGDTRSAWTERELVSTVRSFLLQKRFEDFDEAEAAAGSFVEYCRGRAWVLTEVGTTSDGEPLFSFTHRTFLEFFAANQLVRTNHGPRQLLDTLLPHIYREEWDVVAQLAVLLLDRNIDGGADEFLSLVVEETKALPIDARPAALSFAARLLSYLVPTPPTTRRVLDACWELACAVDGDGLLRERLTAAARLLAAAEENRDLIATLIRQRVRDDPHHGLAALLAVNLDQLVSRADVGRLKYDWRVCWSQESVNNSELVHDTLVEKARTHTWAAVELTFGGEWSVTELIATHGASSVCEYVPVWGGSYRRAPLIQQEILAGHGLDVSPKGPVLWISPHAGTWAEQLADVLPHAPTPWARDFKMASWDMSITNPTNNTPPGTAAFDVLVLGACLYWEARWAVDLNMSPLPSWLRFHDKHPLNDVMTHAAAQRYDLYTCDKPPTTWLSPATQDIVDRWAAGGVNLVYRAVSVP